VATLRARFHNKWRGSCPGSLWRILAGEAHRKRKGILWREEGERLACEEEQEERERERELCFRVESITTHHIVTITGIIQDEEKEIISILFP